MAWGFVDVSPGSRIASSRGVLITIVQQVRTVRKGIFHCILSFRTAIQGIQNIRWEDVSAVISIAPGLEMGGITRRVKTWLTVVRVRWDRGRIVVSSMGMKAEAQKMDIAPVDRELFASEKYLFRKILESRGSHEIAAPTSCRLS